MDILDNQIPIQMENVVVIAVDASKHAERAFQQYCENHIQKWHKIVLVHAAEYPKPKNGETHSVWYTKDIWEVENRKKEAEMSALRDHYLDKMRNMNMVGETRFIFHNVPGEAVVRVAREMDAHLIVTGTRGLGTVRRTILGSTSDYILHHAHCPVLVCPPLSKRSS